MSSEDNPPVVFLEIDQGTPVDWIHNAGSLKNPHHQNGDPLTRQQDMRHERPMSQSIQNIAKQVTGLFRQAIEDVKPEVDDIIQGGERHTQRIDHLLDHMLGFCCDPDMLLEFKRLCRYYFTIDPVATAEHVQAYREMWDTPDELASEPVGRVSAA
jgi:hypothetical protein